MSVNRALLLGAVLAAAGLVLAAPVAIGVPANAGKLTVGLVASSTA